MLLPPFKLFDITSEVILDKFKQSTYAVTDNYGNNYSENNTFSCNLCDKIKSTIFIGTIRA